MLEKPRYSEICVTFISVSKSNRLASLIFKRDSSGDVWASLGLYFPDDDGCAVYDSNTYPFWKIASYILPANFGKVTKLSSSVNSSSWVKVLPDKSYSEPIPFERFWTTDFNNNRFTTEIPGGTKIIFGSLTGVYMAAETGMTLSIANKNGQSVLTLLKFRDSNSVYLITDRDDWAGVPEAELVEYRIISYDNDQYNYVSTINDIVLDEENGPYTVSCSTGDDPFFVFPFLYYALPMENNKKGIDCEYNYNQLTKLFSEITAIKEKLDSMFTVKDNTLNINYEKFKE